MFVQLKPMLKACTGITITMVDGDDGKVRLTVIPKPKAGDTEEALKTPLVLTATAEELDEGLAEHLTSYSNAYVSLAEQLESTTAILAAAKTTSEKKAVKALTKGTPGGKDGELDDDTPDTKPVVQVAEKPEAKGVGEAEQSVVTAPAVGANLFDVD